MSARGSRCGCRGSTWCPTPLPPRRRRARPACLCKAPPTASLAPSPGTKKPPNGFRGADPHSYPAVAWDAFDGLVQGAAARGINVLPGRHAYSHVNADSTAAALKALAAMARGRPSWAVLGPMAELGDETIAAHDRVGRLAVRLGVTHLVTVGEDARAVHEAARQEGMFGGEAIFAATIDDAIAVLRARMEPDAVVLVKASRAAGLERVALALEVPDA